MLKEQVKYDKHKYRMYPSSIELFYFYKMERKENRKYFLSTVVGNSFAFRNQENKKKCLF